MHGKQNSGILKLLNATTLTNVILVANAFIWYYSVLIAIQNTLEKTAFQVPMASILIWGAHIFGLILSALMGALIAKRIERTRFLTLWMVLGVLSSLTMFALDVSNFIVLGFVSLTLGISLGFGMPTCMSFFSDSVPIEGRGKIAGITMLLSGVGIFLFANLPVPTYALLGIALSIWRLSSLFIFRYSKSRINVKAKLEVASYRQLVRQQSFLTYFVPWLMFSLVNYLVAPLEPNAGVANGLLMLAQTGFMAVFAVTGGFLIDRIGRKRIAIAGFTMLGLAVAMVGAFPTGDFSPYVSAMLEGSAWGLLLDLFIITVWGDLGGYQASDKIYALGVMPFFLSKFLAVTMGTYIVSNISTTAIFPFTALFLFLAVLPLFYAPETLPEKVMKDRDLKSYVEKAMKKVEIEVGIEKTVSGEPQECDVEFQVKPEEIDEDQEEAERLAEKYY
jgi:MFS family permease